MKAISCIVSDATEEIIIGVLKQLEAVSKRRKGGKRVIRVGGDEKIFDTNSDHSVSNICVDGVAQIQHYVPTRPARRTQRFHLPTPDSLDDDSVSDDQTGGDAMDTQDAVDTTQDMGVQVTDGTNDSDQDVTVTYAPTQPAYQVSQVPTGAAAVGDDDDDDDTDDMDADDRVKIENAVEALMESNVMFTAYDVTKKVRRENANFNQRHGDIKSVVHSMYNDGDMAGYTRSLISVSGAPVQPFLYHPVAADVQGYDPNGSESDNIATDATV